ncbi:MAG: ABC transporter substrate-binding protein [Veillonellales bacterium]
MKVSAERKLKTVKYYGRAAVMVLLVSLLLAAAGCAGSRPSSSGAVIGKDGYQVTDTQGHILHLSHKPQRIVTLSLSSDEMVLGMTGPERVAALNHLADDPGISTIADKAASIPSSARMRDYNAEMIVSFQPDLVIVPDWIQADLIQTLRDLGLPVFVSKGPSTVVEVKQAIREIAQSIGEEEAGARMVAAMDTELADLAAKTAAIPPEQRRSVVLVSHMASYGGKGSLFDDMCGYAGVVNGAAAAGLGKNDALTKECIVKINPDLILLPTWKNGKLDVDKVKSDMQDDPAFQNLTAIRTKRLVQLSDAYLYCASQDIVQAIRDIYNAAYQE